RAYDGVSDLIFTGDSSKAVYAAENQRKRFVIAEDKEFGGWNYLLNPPGSAPGSPHFAYICNDPMARLAGVGGKPVWPGKWVGKLRLQRRRLALRGAAWGGSFRKRDAVRRRRGEEVLHLQQLVHLQPRRQALRDDRDAGEPARGSHRDRRSVPAVPARDEQRE